jgi:hypothetical protein
MLGLTALGLLGRSVISSMEGGSTRPDEPAGVLLSPPSGYRLTEMAEPSFEAAAAELEAQASKPGAGPLGLHFRRNGTEVYWLADPGADRLEERTAGAGGTRLQTIWTGGLGQGPRLLRGRGTAARTAGESVPLRAGDAG